MRVLIVAPNISMRMGGEAVLPYHYIRELRKAGLSVSALTHARVRAELEASELDAGGGLHFIEDAPSERALYALSRAAPRAVADSVFGTGVAAVTLARLGRRARVLCRQTPFDIVHQPTPVSPLFPSFLTGFDAPVVIGPLNGGMNFPEAFERDYSGGGERAVRLARALSGIANRAAPGKLQAARILVANARTRAALPAAIDPGRVLDLTDNGVDLSHWSPDPCARADIPTFVFVGRLIALKAVDLLIEAFARLQTPARLVVIGDGDQRQKLEALAALRRSDARDIEFAGFQPQAEIRNVLARATALVLPSLRECGGAVILEAFACRTPAIAAAWGGPKDYVTPETGFLVAPEGKEEFIRGLTAAMHALAVNPALAARMGEAARARILSDFSWEAKARAMISVYEGALSERAIAA